MSTCRTHSKWINIIEWKEQNIQNNNKEKIESITRRAKNKNDENKEHRSECMYLFLVTKWNKNENKKRK